MGNPIVLTDKTRGSWANPNEVSTLLDKMMKFIAETLSTNGVKEGSDEDLFRINVSKNIISLFSIENHSKLATIGAYYRRVKNNELVTLNDKDWECISEVLTSIGIKKEQHLIHLNAFISTAPRESHIAFIKNHLFTSLIPNILKDVRSKYAKPVADLIEGTLRLVEFVNTPFVVLQAEEDNDKTLNSSVDLQWTQMHKTIEGAMATLIDIKTPSPKQVIKVQQKKLVLKTMSEKKTEISRELVIFQGVFGIANHQIESQKETERLDTAVDQIEKPYEILLTKYKRLASYIHQLLPSSEPKEFDPNEDLRPYIIKYGEAWADRYRNLSEIRQKERSTIPDHAQHLEEQITLLKSEKEALQQTIQNLYDSNNMVVNEKREAPQQEFETQLDPNSQLQNEIMELRQERQALYDTLEVLKQERQESLKRSRELKKEIDELRAKCQTRLESIKKFKKENEELTSQVFQLTQIESLKSTTSFSMESILSWINSLISTITELTAANTKLTDEKTLLEEENKKLLDTSTPPPVSPFTLDNVSAENPVTIDSLQRQFENKFINTNSTGIKDMIAYMTLLQDKSMLEVDKLCLLSRKMQEIASQREKSSWSKSHFFGKGRHKGVQELYEFLAKENFSLNNLQNVSDLNYLLNDPDTEFTFSASKP